MAEVFGDAFREHLDAERTRLNTATDESIHVERDGEDMKPTAKDRRVVALKPHPAGECSVCDNYVGNPPPAP